MNLLIAPPVKSSLRVINCNILELLGDFSLVMAFRTATVSSDGFTDEIQEGVKSGIIPGTEVFTCVI